MSEAVGQFRVIGKNDAAGRVRIEPADAEDPLLQSTKSTAFLRP